MTLSLSPGYTKVGLFPRLFRDISAVQDAGRLRIADLSTATHAVAGAIIFLMNALLEGELPPRGASERVAAMVLRMLGANEEEIAPLVSRPLPELRQSS
jgi:hypothetical protein